MPIKMSDAISGFGAVAERPKTIPNGLTGIKAPARDKVDAALPVTEEDIRARMEYEAAMAAPSKRFKTDIAALQKAGITNREHEAVFEASQDMLRRVNSLRLAPESKGQFPTMAVYLELAATLTAAVAHTYLSNVDKEDIVNSGKTGELPARTRMLVGMAMQRSIEILRQAVMEGRPVI